MIRSVMLGVRAPGAEPLGPIIPYLRRLTRPRRGRARRRAAADEHGVLQPTPAQRGAVGERDGRRCDDEDDADAQAQD